jgi:diguanylate cyclase (GGDEF)-like protein
MIDDDFEDEKTNLHDVASLGVSDKTRASPCLVVVSGKSSAGKMFKLRGDMVVGRSSEAEIYLDDDGISRRHAMVHVRPDGQVEVRDLGSTNGTYWNGQRIAPLAVLKDGDKIQVGSATILKFSYQDALEEALQRNLYESVTRDALTKAYNRKHLDDTLKKEIAFALRNRSELTLVMFDIDHFKVVNDTYGHPAGDHVLTKLALRVNECIRTEDTLARYGGEEFAIVLPEIDHYNAMAFADKVRKLVEIAEFKFEDTLIPVTVSIGVASLRGEIEDALEFIKQADTQLFAAKEAGRNQVKG